VRGTVNHRAGIRNPSQQGTLGTAIAAHSASRDLDLWAYQRGITLDFSRPGHPTDNAFIEAYNRLFGQNV
jgi:transposase InsO family protein